jgi:hypothetical protein
MKVGTEVRSLYRLGVGKIIEIHTAWPTVFVVEYESGRVEDEDAKTIRPLDKVDGDLSNGGFAVGAIITDNGRGFPITRGIGSMWYRIGWDAGKTWDEVVAWHKTHLSDPTDDSDEPFTPVLMVPQTDYTTTNGKR